MHVQKTGGNSISTALLPFSDDQKTIKKHQNGHDRFGIKGDVTPRKHAWLQEYYSVLGENIYQYEIVTSVKGPLERAVSMYFSPHRWYKLEEKEWTKVEPFWCFKRFSAIASKMYRLVDFLTIDGTVRSPDHLIRFETLQNDFEALAIKYALPINRSHLPHVNKSASNSALYQTAYNDRQVRDLVKSRFKEDYLLLEIFE